MNSKEEIQLALNSLNTHQELLISQKEAIERSEKMFEAEVEQNKLKLHRALIAPTEALIRAQG